MRQIVSAAAGLWLCLGMSAIAEGRQGVVVELYTSQGCSSCPPADENLAALVDAPGVIALALHVDYWDYIGWSDTFADPKFTKRQKGYANAAGSKMIYTPQIIVNGRDRVEGNQAAKVAKAVSRGLGVDSPVTLIIDRDGDTVIIRAVANPPLSQGTRIQVVRYINASTVQIERGENAGKSITYRNIVTSWTDVGGWQGDQPLETSATATGDAPIVVIIQSAGFGEILAAAEID